MAYEYIPTIRSDDFESCVKSIEHPTVIGSINNGTYSTIAEIINTFQEGGYLVKQVAVQPEAYLKYLSDAGYRSLYPEYYRDNFCEKTLEHFLAALSLNLTEDDVFIDVASEHSPIPEIYKRLYKVTSYRQDIMYPAGINGDTIGGDACNMPIPDNFADKLALTCSLEHFERDADSGLIQEFNRILKPGGIAYIVPFYLYNKPAVQTDPLISVPNNVVFDRDATVYCSKGWGNRHGRFYSLKSFQERIVPYLGDLQPEVQYILNTQEIDQSCYCRFALKLTKPRQ